MRIPILLGQPLHLWLGILLLLMIIFQIAVAKRILKVPFKWHRIVGYLVLFVALLHGFIAFGLNNSIFVL